MGWVLETAQFLQDLRIKGIRARCVSVGKVHTITFDGSFNVIPQPGV